MATSSSDEHEEEYRNVSALAFEYLSEPNENEPNESEISYKFTLALQQQGYEDWEIVDRASDPLIHATISTSAVVGSGWRKEQVDESMEPLIDLAYVCECVKDKSSGHRIYFWRTFVEGATGISTQQEIYQRHPDMFPLILTVTCFADDGRIAVSACRQSGEAVPTVHLRKNKCHSAHVEMMTKFAEALGHNIHGLVLLTPNGDCLHDVAKFALEFRAQQEALRKQQDAVAGAGSQPKKRRYE